MIDCEHKKLASNGDDLFCAKCGTHIMNIYKDFLARIAVLEKNQCPPAGCAAFHLEQERVKEMEDRHAQQVQLLSQLPVLREALADIIRSDVLSRGGRLETIAKVALSLPPSAT